MLAEAPMTDTSDSATGSCGPDRASFDVLEMRVLRLVAAGHEQTGEGRLRRTADAILGRRGGGPLADNRLETLRREAVAVFKGGREAVGDFFAAGYSACQLEAVRAMMTAARPAVTTARLQHAGGIALGLGGMAGFVTLTAAMLTGI